MVSVKESMMLEENILCQILPFLGEIWGREVEQTAILHKKGKFGLLPFDHFWGEGVVKDMAILPKTEKSVFLPFGHS